jgi:dipeptidyl aminopeptidase/acylaminoacyl peptidase
MGFELPKWSSRLAQAGFITVTGCWDYISGSAESDPVRCPHDRALAAAAIDALIRVGRGQLDARKDALALYGQSFGGFATYQQLETRRDVTAAVIDSGMGLAYPRLVNAAVLILGGTADQSVPIQTQRQCYQQLLDARKTVEAHFYDGGGHVVISDPHYGTDATTQIVGFLKRYLTLRG